MTTLASDMLSNFGDVLYYLALMNYVLLLPTAKFAISLISASETFPILSAFLILVEFLAAIAGQYENGLYTSISLRVVSNDDRQDALAFRQAISFDLDIAFQGAGAVLITFLSYRTHAFLNSGTFLICGLIIFSLRPSLKALLCQEHYQTLGTTSVETRKSEASGLLNELWLGLKDALRELMHIDELPPLMIIVPIMNGMFSSLSLIVVLLIAEDKQFVIVNSATTLATISIVTAISNVLGNVLSMRFLRHAHTINLLLAELLLSILLFAGFYYHNIFWVLMILGIMIVLLGFINPKFVATMMNQVLEDKIATVSNGTTSYFQAGNILMKLLLSGLILLVKSSTIIVLMILLSVGLTIYGYSIKRKEGL